MAVKIKIHFYWTFKISNNEAGVQIYTFTNTERYTQTHKYMYIYILYIHIYRPPRWSSGHHV
jgi:hypothetical protein